MSKSSRLGWLTALFLPFLYVSVHAATPSPTSVTLIPGQAATVKLSNINGTVTLSNSNTTVMAATLTSYNTVKVTGKAVGSATLSIKDRSGTKYVAVTVKAVMSISPTSLSVTVGQSAKITASNVSGLISVTNSDFSKISTSVAGNVITVTGREAGEAKITVHDDYTSKEVPVKVTAVTTPPVVGGNLNGRLLASNCFQCHGTNGTGGFDQIAGESESELLSELRKFASGAEGNGIMAAHAMGYTDAQMQAIAKYLAAQ